MSLTQSTPGDCINNSFKSWKDLPTRPTLTASVKGSQKTTCPTCNKLISSYKFSVHLKTHLAVGERVKFKCSVAQCSKRFFCKSKLKRHVVLDHSLSPRSKHKCDHCSQECTEMGNLRRHIRKCHPGSVIKYPCHLCDATFKSADERASHRVTAHPDPEIFKCSVDQCWKEFNRRSSLRRHVNECHSESFTKFPCRLCDSGFMSKCGLNDHIVAVHTGEKAFRCDKCPLKFASSSKLARHRFVHTEERPHQCKQCPRQFKLKYDLKLHLGRVHSKKTKNLKCSICGKGFSIQADLNKHSKTHNLELGPFSCYFCSKRFTRRNYLESHLRIHTQEKPFFCFEDSCKYSATYPTSLRNHSKRHHLPTRSQSTATKTWICYFCSKTLTQPTLLTTHLRRHTLETPFPCVMCQKSFKCNSNLQRHIFTHTNEKPFSCPHCQKRFTTNGDIRRHVASTHNKEKRFFCKFCSYSSYAKRNVHCHQMSRHC